MPRPALSDSMTCVLDHFEQASAFNFPFLRTYESLQWKSPFYPGFLPCHCLSTIELLEKTCKAATTPVPRTVPALPRPHSLLSFPCFNKTIQSPTTCQHQATHAAANRGAFLRWAPTNGPTLRLMSYPTLRRTRPRGEPRGRNVRSKIKCSACPAIHTYYRS